MAFLPAGEEGDSDDWDFEDNDDLLLPPVSKITHGQIGGLSKESPSLLPNRSEIQRVSASNRYHHDSGDGFRLEFKGSDDGQNTTISNSTVSSHASGDSSRHVNNNFHKNTTSSWIPSQNAWPSKSSFLTSEDFQRAAVKGNVGILERCITQGLTVDEPLRHGWTALMFSVNYANVQAVQFLLKNGANPRHGSDMYSPLMAACNACTGSDHDIAECVRQLLDAGADVNAKDRHHTTCLMLACREGHLATVQLLIQKGGAVNIQDYKGWTPLTWATQRQRKAVVAELMEAGADCNIQHVDKLTVKDLAAHLPTDEMLALLERRPPNVVNSSGETVVDTSKRLSEDSSNCIMDLGEAQAKLTDLRYGELEVFLIGLDLPHVVGICRRQGVDLDLLLNLTEADLINAGISQIGARKKILDAAQTVHKKDWETSSLVSIHYNKKITCADAVAVVANSSKHIRYISSSIMYVKGQLRRHPEAILQATDRVSPGQLLRHTEDAMRNLASLKEELRIVHKELKYEMSSRSCDPSDSINNKSRLWTQVVKSLLAVSVAVTLSGLVIVKRDVVKDSLNTVIMAVSSAVR